LSSTGERHLLLQWGVCSSSSTHRHRPSSSSPPVQLLSVNPESSARSFQSMPCHAMPFHWGHIGGTVGKHGGLQHFNMLADCHTTFILFAIQPSHVHAPFTIPIPIPIPNPIPVPIPRRSLKASNVLSPHSTAFFFNTSIYWLEKSRTRAKGKFTT